MAMTRRNIKEEINDLRAYMLNDIRFKVRDDANGKVSVDRKVLICETIPTYYDEDIYEVREYLLTKIIYNGNLHFIFGPMDLGEKEISTDTLIAIYDIIDKLIEK